MTSSGRNTEQKERDRAQSKSSTSDFTIDHILHRAGSTSVPSYVQKFEAFASDDSDNGVLTAFPWLHCTRYRPPKIPSKYLATISVLVFDLF